MSKFINIEIIGLSIAVAHLSGEIDVHALPEVEAELQPFAQDMRLQRLVLHCADLAFIDSKVVGYIAYLRTTFTKSNRQLALAEINETVNDILSLVGLTQIIPCFNSLEEAIKTPVQ